MFHDEETKWSTVGNVDGSSQMKRAEMFIGVSRY